MRSEDSNGSGELIQQDGSYEQQIKICVVAEG